MNDFVDLHCHYLPAVDDGAKTLAESLSMLVGLAEIGFKEVVATPHMRPGLYDTEPSLLRAAFAGVLAACDKRAEYPALSLSSEHYFDDVVYGRILADRALPYPSGKAILLEFYDTEFPFSIDHRLADILRHGLTPVIAHPERYQPIERHPEILERLLDLGAVALLDVAALIGKYGRHAARCAEELLERGYYAAACSDAHSPKDIRDVARGIEWVRGRYGDEEVTSLLATGPRALLPESASQ